MVLVDEPPNPVKIEEWSVSRDDHSIEVESLRYLALRSDAAEVGVSQWAKNGKIVHGGPENLRKVQAKKFRKSNKSISRKKFFDQIPIFAISTMPKNQFLNWEKV